MSGILAFFVNPYDRKARLHPALLTALPILSSIVLLIPEFGTILASVGGLFLYCGATTFLAQVVRDRGKRLEPSLYRSWGGKPSVVMLRHSDTRIDPTTKERYRSFLNSVVPNLRLASEDEERKCPKKADKGYESATSWLRACARKREHFDLLFKENINYGFRRNIWALKPWAFIFDAAAILLIAILNFDSWTYKNGIAVQPIAMQNWVCITVTIIHVLIFAFILREKWIRTAAEAYARQLLAVCDTLEFERKT